MTGFGSVLYLCDGKACDNPDNCVHNGTGECRHTSLWEHAINKGTDLKDFISRPSRESGRVDLWEPFDE